MKKFNKKNYLNIFYLIFKYETKKNKKFNKNKLNIKIKKKNDKIILNFYKYHAKIIIKKINPNFYLNLLIGKMLKRKNIKNIWKILIVNFHYVILLLINKKNSD